MCDRLDEWAARRATLEHDVAEGAAATAAGGGRSTGARGRVDIICPPLTLLKSSRYGVQGELQSSATVVATAATRQLLPAGWVSEIGGGKGQWDRVSGYWRFSDQWRPGDAMFSSSGAPPARAVFMDLSKHALALEAVGGYHVPSPIPDPSSSPAEEEMNGSSSEEKKSSWTAFGSQPALAPPVAMLTLETSTSPPSDDVSEEHDKVKALVDVVFAHTDSSSHSPSGTTDRRARAGTSTGLSTALRSGPALRCAAPRGGPLDVGCYHSDLRRCRFTAELYVAFDPARGTDDRLIPR